MFIFFAGTAKVCETQEMILHGLLAKYFGVAALHQWQLRTILATLDGRDGLVIQPTGSGKSICFYLPPLVTRKTALVVTPTISLMTDQVAKLESKGISATFLGTAQVDKSIMPKVAEGIFSVVFTTPETLIERSTGHPRRPFVKMAEERKLCMVAVDEAHLIQSWQNFRYVRIEYI